jgi:hypothetical protein
MINVSTGEASASWRAPADVMYRAPGSGQT